MAELREISVTLLDWETRYILQSISNELKRLTLICEKSSDDNEIADAGNDFLELSGLYEELATKAVSAFGSQIINFDNKEL